MFINFLFCVNLNVIVPMTLINNTKVIAQSLLDESLFLYKTSNYSKMFQAMVFSVLFCTFLVVPFYILAILSWCPKTWSMLFCLHRLFLWTYLKLLLMTKKLTNYSSAIHWLMTCYFAIFHTKGKLVKCLERFKAAVLQMLKK